MKFATTLAVWLMSVSISAATLCIKPGTPCQWYALHHGQPTFIGTALSDEVVSDVLDLGGRSLSVTVHKVMFRVEERFEGTLDSTVDIYGYGTVNDFHFEVGTRYVVYAGLGKDGKLRTAKCTRTAPLSEAAEDISFLRSLPWNGGAIQGLVRFVSPGTQSGTVMGTITASGVDGDYKTRVPASGWYELRGLPPGTYRETFTPDDYSTESISFTLPIRVDGGCASSGVRLGNLTVSGQATTEAGSPVPGLEIFLHYALDGKFEKSVALRTRTDDHGRFSFNRVEAAKYILQAQSESEAIFFPGTRDASKTQLIEVHDGESVSGLTIRVPADPGSKTR